MANFRHSDGTGGFSTPKVTTEGEEDIDAVIVSVATAVTVVAVAAIAGVLVCAMKIRRRNVEDNKPELDKDSAISRNKEIHKKQSTLKSLPIMAINTMLFDDEDDSSLSDFEQSEFSDTENHPNTADKNSYFQNNQAFSTDIFKNNGLLPSQYSNGCLSIGLQNNGFIPDTFNRGHFKGTDKNNHVLLNEYNAVGVGNDDIDNPSFLVKEWKPKKPQRTKMLTSPKGILKNKDSRSKSATENMHEIHNNHNKNVRVAENNPSLTTDVDYTVDVRECNTNEKIQTVTKENHIVKECNNMTSIKNNERCDIIAKVNFEDDLQKITPHKMKDKLNNLHTIENNAQFYLKKGFVNNLDKDKQLYTELYELNSLDVDKMSVNILQGSEKSSPLKAVSDNIGVTPSTPTKPIIKLNNKSKALPENETSAVNSSFESKYNSDGLKLTNTHNIGNIVEITS